MDFPGSWAAPVMIGSTGAYTATLSHYGLIGSGAMGSSTIGANVQILVPLRLPGPFLVRSFWWYNGSVVAGNVDVGIYQGGSGSTTLNRVGSTGSTAQSGTNTVQIAAPSATTIQLDRGQYYMALVFSGGTATVFSSAITNYAAIVSGSTTAGSAAFPLGTTTTQAGVAAGTFRQPWFGISRLASGY